MSGRKYSKAELESSIREAINCKVEAAAICSRARGLAAAVREAAQKTPVFGALAESVSRILGQGEQEMSRLDDALAEETLTRVTMDEVTAYRARLDELKARLNEIIQKCEEGKASEDQRLRAVTLQKQLEASGAEWRVWVPEDFERLVKSVDDTLAQIDSQIQRTGSLGSGRERVERLSEKFSEIQENIIAMKKKDEKRMYLANALEKVCRELGFSVTRLPQERKSADLVLEVNTFAYGIIHFRIELDSIIRSQSEMIQASCHSNFTQIEEKLKHLGVTSRFRYEGNQAPVRLHRGEKTLAGQDSEPAMHRESGAP